MRRRVAYSKHHCVSQHRVGMARAVVLIFLLDAVPELTTILNQTLHDTLVKTHPDSTLQKCNPNIATSILERAYLEIKGNAPNWKIFQTKEGTFEELKKLPTESAYDEGAVFDNSIFNSGENSIENSDSQDYIDNKIEMNDFGFEPTFHENSSVARTKDVELISPPFLVAIFETVSNVTAQTCAGTFISAHWVVTAASCVGVLSEFYGNGTNITESSRYTIVAGSTNPLMDGSIHNVTEILLHPSLKKDFSKNVSNTRSIEKDLPKNISKAKIAMLRISPGLAVEKMKILEEKEVSEAVVYVWTLAVHESGNDALLPTSIAVKKTNSSQCQTKDGELTYGSSGICFNPEPKTHGNSTKLGVGGPVLVHGEMLGVVTDDRVPMLVEPLAAHAWIITLLNDDNF